MEDEVANWTKVLNGDPLPWLLGDETPSVRHLALVQLLDRPARDDGVVLARAAAMAAHPIAAILAAQQTEGYWGNPGTGYGSKYTGTPWNVIFLDQLGADGADPRVRAACEYVLAHAQTAAGGFGATYEVGDKPPPPSAVIHCLNGNLLRALLGFGWGDDERVRRAIDWQINAVTGEGSFRYYQVGTSGPAFACAANEKQPCAWGAIKGVLALARVPAAQRTPRLERAIEMGAEFLLSRDPAVADYPIPSYSKKPNGSWFKLMFPIGYVTDVLQNLEALCELGYGRDPRLANAVNWLLAKQDKQGRWPNEYAYNGKTVVDFEKQGRPSKWVTLRACRVLKAVYG